jgi:hypothetical protein
MFCCTANKNKRTVINAATDPALKRFLIFDLLYRLLLADL